MDLLCRVYSAYGSIADPLFYRSPQNDSPSQNKAHEYMYINKYRDIYIYICLPTHTHQSPLGALYAPTNHGETLRLNPKP